MPQHLIYTANGVTGSGETQAFQVPVGRARGEAEVTLATPKNPSSIFDLKLELMQSEDGVNWTVRDTTWLPRTLDDTDAMVSISRIGLEDIENLYLKVRWAFGQASVSVTVALNT